MHGIIYRSATSIRTANVTSIQNWTEIYLQQISIYKTQSHFKFCKDSYNYTHALIYGPEPFLKSR
jgi:hypothetical protein